MAVHRPSASGDDHEKVSLELGHLLLTIDDFESLIEQIRTHTQEEPSVSFIGGDIDKAEDLRLLADRELAYFKIQSGHVTVELTHRRALYSGPRSMAPKIQEWSRLHERRVPAKLNLRKMIYFTLGSEDSLPPNFPLMVMPIILLIYGIFTFLTIFRIGTVTAIIGTIGLLSLTWAGFYCTKARKVGSSCVITPLSRDEYRKDRTARNRQTVTWTIATIAIAATLIAAQIKK
ncbi:hypothetical protein [Nocardia sp. NRRL S-836]|uniref:hypothetical protein n=1 Tax=Nocardia sp. NRRL S-836 TaxID=1519492 RepID=UPI0012F97539|nr:hypothetical protein [Nocardia sp. NRRL S-836]